LTSCSRLWVGGVSACFLRDASSDYHHFVRVLNHDIGRQKSECQEGDVDFAREPGSRSIQKQ
jgi:hypothetical protein